MSQTAVAAGGSAIALGITRGARGESLAGVARGLVRLVLAAVAVLLTIRAARRALRDR